MRYLPTADYKKDIETSQDPEALRRELETHYEKLQSPFRTAEQFGVHDIIDPRDTRPILCNWIDQAYHVLPEQLEALGRTMRVLDARGKEEAPFQLNE